MHTPAWLATARAVADLPPEDFAARYAALTDPEDQREALRMRFRYDLASFCRYCWPDRFGLPFNDLHHALFRDAAEVQPYNAGRPTVHDAVAAPRGFAKSTISSFATPAHAIVYDLEAFIVLMSAGRDLATDLSADLRAAFESPDSPFAQLYGPFTLTGGVEKWEVSVQGRPSIAVTAKSFGTEVRGIKHRTRGIRPTRVIIDDGEKKDRVRNAEQRQIWWNTLTKDILKLGAREGGTLYQVRGTVLHADSMLANLMDNPGWRSQRWKAIIAWPEREDLWRKCGDIWKNLRLGEKRKEAARAFYEANRAEMDRGAEVLDPAAGSLFALYEEIWGKGLGAFLQEMQNEPRDTSASFFNSHEFARCRVKDGHVYAADGTPIPLSSLSVVARLDPIPGKELGVMGEDAGSGAGDFAAIAIIGRDRHRYGYVLDLWLKRARDSDQLEALWELAEHWGVRRVSIESNGFQRLFGRDFRRMQADRKAAGRFWQLVIDEDTSTKNKEDRIASLEPAVANGWLQFNETLPRAVFEQFDDFPSGAHDDAPDAIEGAWRMNYGAVPSMSQQRIR